MPPSCAQGAGRFKRLCGGRHGIPFRTLAMPPERDSGLPSACRAESLPPAQHLLSGLRVLPANISFGVEVSAIRVLGFRLAHFQAPLGLGLGFFDPTSPWRAEGLPSLSGLEASHSIGSAKKRLFLEFGSALRAAHVQTLSANIRPPHTFFAQGIWEGLESSGNTVQMQSKRRCVDGSLGGGTSFTYAFIMSRNTCICLVV